MQKHSNVDGLQSCERIKKQYIPSLKSIKDYLMKEKKEAILFVCINIVCSFANNKL
ncbi:MAG: hypothetical protein H6Q13_797 [Bacteroidetes bacterium]|nr:hypothetical protein [Bacteroidota bacterium]